MFEHLKYLLIEYIHLILPVAIIMGLFINNMPVNFGFGKFTDQYVPREFTKAMSKSIGIDADEYPKAYSFIASIYRALKSIISPDYKTTLFKVIMIIFIISILFGYHYSMVFEDCILIITGLSGIFWMIFGASSWIANKIDPKADPQKWFEEHFDNLQVDTYWLLLNTICSLIVTTFIFLIFKIVLNVQIDKAAAIGIGENTNSSNGLIGRKFLRNMNLGIDFKKYPEVTTICLSILIMILYYRIDGIVYLTIDTTKYYGKKIYKWGETLIDISKPGDMVQNILWFLVYFSIFVYILLYKYKVGFKESIIGKIPSMEHLSLFNILADETHHPILVFGFYFYFFLCREKYTGGYFYIFVFITVIEYLKTSGYLGSLFGKIAGKLPPGMENKLSDMKDSAKNAASNMGSNMTGATDKDIDWRDAY